MTILGYRPDAPRLTAAADLFVLASHHEGIPVAVMEALAAGVPVVATRVGGLAEAIDDGTSGRLVPVRRPELLADAIVELAADPDEPPPAVGRRLGGRRPVLGPSGRRSRSRRSTTLAAASIGRPRPSGPASGHTGRGDAPSGTSRTTTAPAPITAHGPMVRPGVTMAPVPRNAPSPIVDRSVDEHAGAERGVVADHRVVRHDRVHVDLHVATDGDVRRDAGPGGQHRAVAEAHVGPDRGAPGAPARGRSP